MSCDAGVCVSCTICCSTGAVAAPELCCHAGILGCAGRTSGICLFCELQRCALQCSQKKGGVVTPSNIVNNLRGTRASTCALMLCSSVVTYLIPLWLRSIAINKRFRLGRQEDSHEFIRFVMDALQTNVLAGHKR